MRVILRLLSALFLTWGLVIFILTMLLMLPFILLSASLKSRKGSIMAFFFLRIWAYLVTVLCFFPVITRNRRTLPLKKAYIYISNHNSYLDSPAIVIACPNAFKPLGKIEMTKIPIFGAIYKKVVVLIDRSSKESRAVSVEKLKKELSQGMSVLIFPEGTMNKSDKPLTEFYDGAFRIAIETQTPIAPMVIINARKLMPRSNPLTTRPGIITCIFDKPVETAGLTLDDLPELKANVHRSMEQLIEANQR